MASPVFNDQMFGSPVNYSGDSMTVQGTVNKAFILTGLCLATAAFTWYQWFNHAPMAEIQGWFLLGLVGSLVCGLILFFSQASAPYVAPVYALAEGLLLGTVSAQFDGRYSGIAFRAIALTMAILVAVLLAYKARLIQATEKFRAIVIVGFLGVMLVSVVSLVIYMITGHPLAMITDSSPISIIFSLACVVLASMFLVLNFDMIERGEINGAPKYMEWYSAYGLLVTLIWLYLEILQLLAKLQSRQER